MSCIKERKVVPIEEGRWQQEASATECSASYRLSRSIMTGVGTKETLFILCKYHHFAVFYGRAIRARRQEELNIWDTAYCICEIIG